MATESHLLALSRRITETSCSGETFTPRLFSSRLEKQRNRVVFFENAPSQRHPFTSRIHLEHVECKVFLHRIIENQRLLFSQQSQGALVQNKVRQSKKAC